MIKKCSRCNRLKEIYGNNLCRSCYQFNLRKEKSQFITCSGCNRDRKLYAKNLCHSCYIKKWKKTEKGKEVEKKYTESQQRRMANRRNNSKYRCLMDGVYFKVKKANYKYKKRGNLCYKEVYELLKKTNGYCLRCGNFFGIRKLTLDHIVPFAKNGKNVVENIQFLCFSCNSSKSDKLEKKF